MTKGQRIAVFIVLVVVGLFFQTFLGMHCRCHWGAFNSRMIYGAMVVDAWILIRLIVATFRRRFIRDCLTAGIIVVSSPFWIPVAFKAVLALHIFPKGEPLRNLFH